MKLGKIVTHYTTALSRLAGSSKGGTVAQARRKAKATRRRRGKDVVEGSGPMPGSELPAPPKVDSRVIDGQWEEFKRLYPGHRLDEEVACRALLSRDEEAADIVAGLRVAVTCEDWTKDGGKFVPKASNFIADGKYKDHLRAAVPAKKPAFFDPRSITRGGD